MAGMPCEHYRGMPTGAASKRFHLSRSAVGFRWRVVCNELFSDGLSVTTRQ